MTFTKKTSLFFFLLQLNSFYLILDILPHSQSQKCQLFLVRLGYTSCYAKTWAMSLKSQTKPNAYVSSVRSYLSTYTFFTMYCEHLILKKWNKPNAYVSSVRSCLSTYTFFTMYCEHLILKKMKYTVSIFVCKVRTFWKAHIIWKNLPYGFDVY